MRRQVRAIATPAVAAGFRLAGVTSDAVEDAEAAATRLGVVATEPGVGVLLVEQRLLDGIPEPVRREAERRAVPILVPVPSPAWGEATGAAEDVILELLRRAIGYRVRLR
ncbi:MAG: V-type ATP synthase subunit F [Gemmatimonadota bacterium]|nr:V-type ATP synthase subunit F [Gemmatimonadota bacterium]